MRVRALVAWMPPSSLQGLYLQRPSEVSAHRPAASNKQDCSNGFKQTYSTQKQPNETNHKDT